MKTKKEVTAQIPLDLLPKEAKISGRVIRLELSSFEQVQPHKEFVAWEFQNETVAEIRRKAGKKKKKLARIEITSFTL